jgi:hypothetical protein
MGWLNPHEQRGSKKKYGVTCFYKCDHCNMPIPPGVLFEVNPKGGYHPWPERVPKNARPFLSRDPKVTYHNSGECAELRKGKHKRKNQKKIIIQAAEYIIHKLEVKPKAGYWTKERCLRRLVKKKYERRVALKALKLLRKEKIVRKKKGGYLLV